MTIIHNYCRDPKDVIPDACGAKSRNADPGSSRSPVDNIGRGFNAH